MHDKKKYNEEDAAKTAAIRIFYDESAGLDSDPPFEMGYQETVLSTRAPARQYSNDEVMERFGYRICPQCNGDQVADRFVGPFCEYCGEGEDR
jgi:hypothetical protein